MDSDKPEIVFFDVETTVPTRSGQGFAILEFGAILVCPRKLGVLESYSTLVRPSDLSLLNSLSVRCNGITRADVISAPSFLDISEEVYRLLHGRIWAGHNILKFDCARIREAFAEIGQAAPEPKGTIDSLVLLTQRFGRRAGNMKMATLATYFGLGQQLHRSLADVKMNLDVLKCCATVLFLESSLPDIFTENSWVSPNATTRSRSNGKAAPEETKPNKNSPSQSRKLESATLSSVSESAEKDDLLSTPTTSRIGDTILNLVETNSTPLSSFDMAALSKELNSDSLHPDTTMEEITVGSPEMSFDIVVSDDGFLDTNEVSIPSMSASFVPFYRGIQRIRVLYEDAVLQLKCAAMRVRFGLSTKFVDNAGRPRLSFVADAPPTLCQVLDACDFIVQRLSWDSGSNSEWRPTVIRKNGFLNSPTVRLSIPTVANRDATTYDTQVFQKDSSGMPKLVFSKFDPAELDSFLVPGTSLDAYFSLDPYNYQQNAGIRLIAKKLIVNSK